MSFPEILSNKKEYGNPIPLPPQTTVMKFGMDPCKSLKTYTKFKPIPRSPCLKSSQMNNFLLMLNR